MKKLIIVLASVLSIGGLSAQRISSLSTTKTVSSANSINGLSINNPLYDDLINSAPRTPSGHIRCFTEESETIRKSNDPNQESIVDFENWINQKIIEQQNNPSVAKASRNIPVVVHVLYGNASQNISLAQVQSQITALNQDYSATNSDFSLIPSAFQGVAANCDIQFCLAQTDPNGQPTTGVNRVSISPATSLTQTQIQNTWKAATQWDPTKYLNIWVANITGSILGYAQFPSSSGLSGLPVNGGASNTDGVVILYTAFGTTGTATAPYNKGRTASHEIGHWLGLRHIWGEDGSGGCSSDDYVTDTPNQQDENYGCPTYPATQSCSNGGDMWMNYMDYVNDACMYMFTNGQKARMNAVLANSPRRVSLLTSNKCNVASINADFTASATTINVGQSVTFTDASASPNTLNSWNWTFTGGTPSSHNGQTPPAITYSSVGTYTVSLTVTDNASGTDSETKNAYINVINAAACDTLLNIADTDTLKVYGDGAGGYAMGQNQWGMTSHAEKYTSYSPYLYVTGAQYYFYGIVDAGNGATVNFNIWNDVSGAPGTIISSTTIPLSVIASNLTGSPKQGIIEMFFNTPVNVSAGTFYVGITMNGFGSGDKLGLVTNSIYDPTPNSAYNYYSGAWYASEAIFGNPFSMFISPYMSMDIPDANISTNTTTICQGMVVNYSATSSINANSYDWIFNGGTPSTSTSPVQPVSYSAVGTPMTYLIANGNCGAADVDSVSITVTPGNSASAASSSPTVCINNAITNITHTTTGATGIGAATGLPAGVTANWSGGTITISGTPTASGVFNYTIPLTGGCGTANATGTITVNANKTVSAASSSPTVCINNAITNITHTTTGA
ncbi:MAG: PKD domain-containing protein, partial [Flavobacteriales bacterium]|nr:PKD domain-containing protein [Flavobacteriales bacterium]